MWKLENAYGHNPNLLSTGINIVPAQIGLNIGTCCMFRVGTYLHDFLVETKSYNWHLLGDFDGIFLDRSTGLLCCWSQLKKKRSIIQYWLILIYNMKIT
jgi:hypothetical protein